MIRPSGKAVPRTSLESYYCVLYLETFGNSLLHEAFQPRGTNQSSLLNSTVRYYLKLLRICIFMRTIEPHKRVQLLALIFYGHRMSQSPCLNHAGLREFNINYINCIFRESGTQNDPGMHRFWPYAPSPPMTKTLGHP